MKKVFKNKQFILIIIAIIFLSIGIKATTLYYSNQVSYTGNDSESTITTVEDALNELYEKTHNGVSVIYLGTGTSFDISKYDNYDKLTSTNFIISVNSVSGSAYNDVGQKPDRTNYCSCTPVANYNSKTGQLTISGTSGGYSSSYPRVTCSVNVSVYLVMGEIDNFTS